MFHELWIIFTRPFRDFELSTCENILAEYDTSLLMSDKPEMKWGRFFIGDDIGYLSQDEAESMANELCDLIGLTVKIEYEFDYR